MGNDTASSNIRAGTLLQATRSADDGSFDMEAALLEIEQDYFTSKSQDSQQSNQSYEPPLTAVTEEGCPRCSGEMIVLQVKKDGKNKRKRFFKCQADCKDATGKTWIGWVDGKGTGNGKKKNNTNIGSTGMSYADIRKQEADQQRKERDTAATRNLDGTRGDMVKFTKRKRGSEVWEPLKGGRTLGTAVSVSASTVAVLKRQKVGNVSSLESLTVPELKEKCREETLPVGGTKNLNTICTYEHH